MKHLILITALIFTAGLAEAADKAKSEKAQLRQFTGIYTANADCSFADESYRIYVGFSYDYTKTGKQSRLNGLDLSAYSTDVSGTYIGYGTKVVANTDKSPGEALVSTTHKGVVKGNTLTYTVTELMTDGTRVEVERATLVRTETGLQYNFKDKYESGACTLTVAND